jgi:DNA-directed RNA polymerase subunit M/transcription elongation factor TFIIS
LALRCATDVAAALRELHEVGHAHGEVSPASVVLRASGAGLLPPNGLPRKVDLNADVAAFGAVLYEMLTGGKPPRGGPVAAPEEHAPHAGVPGLRAAATRLAAKCLAAPPEQAPTIQMVVTEVRLLNVLAWQSGGESPVPPHSAGAPETRRKANHLAEWGAATEPIEKPEHATPSESFRGGEPTKEFVTAMMSKQPASSPAPHEPGAKLPQEEQGGDPDKDAETEDRAPSPVERCPKCGSNQVHESHPRTKLERFVTNFGIPICRCHRCYHRYFVVFRFALSKSMPPK